MTFFKKNHRQDAVRSTTAHVKRRLATVDTPQLTSWGDTLILQVGSSFDRWRYHQDSIEDAILVAETLGEVLRELKDRLDKLENE